MSDSDTPATDGQSAGDAAAEAAPKPSGSKTFTQEQVDQIVQDRLARAKPADYDQLRADSAELATMKEKDKSDIDRATERATAAEKERDETRTALQREKLERAIEREAFAQSADADLVALALANSPDITVEKDGTISGVKAAVEKLLEAKPHLKIGGVRQSGAEFGGTDNPTIAEKIAALEAKGDKESRAQARELKIQQMQAMTA